MQEKEFVSDLTESMELLSNISELYLKTAPELKPKLIGSIMPGKLYFDGKQCRTSGFSPFIEMLSNDIKASSGIKKLRTSGDISLVLSGSPSGTLSRTFPDTNIIRMDIHRLAETVKLLRA